MNKDGNTAVNPPNLRLLLILEEISRVGVPVTPAQLSEITGLPKQTLRRLFDTLEELAYLQRHHDGRSYSPGPKLRNFADGVISSKRLRDARLVVMRRLADITGETCVLAIPDRDAMTYIDRVDTDRPLQIQLPNGAQAPLHCTASGKLYLSTLSPDRLSIVLDNTALEARTAKTITSKADLAKQLVAIRSTGHAEDDEEFVDGLIALAAPICDLNGRMAMALAFHAPKSRLSLSEAHAYLGRLKGAAKEISDLISKD